MKLSIFLMAPKNRTKRSAVSSSHYFHYFYTHCWFSWRFMEITMSMKSSRNCSCRSAGMRPKKGQIALTFSGKG